MHHDAPPMTATAAYRRPLLAALAVTLVAVVVQVVGAALSGSLALLADAGHLLTDASGILLALAAASLARRRPTKERTFGFQRAEILAALVNGVVLGVVAVSVAVEAVRRWGVETDVEPVTMLVPAVLGGLANLVALLLLRRGQRESLNVRGAYLEVLGDLIGSALVVAAAVVILVTGWTGADVVASLLVAVLIAPRAWVLLRDVVDVLLEATPRGLDLDEVREHMERERDVLGVHDLHAWTITSGVHALSAHVVVTEECLGAGRAGQLLDRLTDCLSEHFDLTHCTFQLEPPGHRDHEGDHGHA